jgi:hypothetical protein
MEELPSFQQRFGIGDKSRIDSDFPETDRRGLLYLLHELVQRAYIPKGWPAIYLELARAGREDFNIVSDDVSPKVCSEILLRMPWFGVYVFCERTNKNLLSHTGHWDGYNNDDWVIDLSLEEVSKFFSDEINNLLSEENIGFEFRDGYFYRPGRIQTQKNINRVTAALSEPRLIKVRTHYNKAHGFFRAIEHPDYENCVKEAVCAMEAATEILSGAKVSQDFSREVNKLSGNETGKLPTPVAQAMIKIYAYRGAGSGVSHGNTNGLIVTRLEAELVLSVVAAFVSYLVDFFERKEPDIPF